MSKASGDDLVSLYSVYLKPTSGGTAARGARGNGAAWSSTDSSLSDSCTAIDISSDNIHDVANYENGGERKEETVGDQQRQRQGEATRARKEREDKDEEDEAQEEGEGYATAEEWDSGGEEGEEGGEGCYGGVLLVVLFGAEEHTTRDGEGGKGIDDVS